MPQKSGYPFPNGLRSVRCGWSRLAAAARTSSVDGCSNDQQRAWILYTNEMMRVVDRIRVERTLAIGSDVSMAWGLLVPKTWSWGPPPRQHWTPLWALDSLPSAAIISHQHNSFRSCENITSAAVRQTPRTSL